MAGKKTQKKTQKRTARRTAVKAGGKKLYKAVKAIAKNEAEKMIETKYITETSSWASNYNMPIKNSLSSTFLLSPPDLNSLQRVIPSVKRGTESDAIIGSRIQMVSGKTDFILNVASNFTKTCNIIVKLFCLESRKCRDYNEMINIPSNTLLRTGNDQTRDWTPSTAVYNPLQDFLPVNKASFKVHHIKHFHFEKNSGLMNNDPAQSSANSPNKSIYKFTWNWGRDMKLKYDDNPLNAGGAEFPTNYAPIWGIVAYYADGSPAGNDDSDTVIYCSAINHMYYKDA